MMREIVGKIYQEIEHLEGRDAIPILADLIAAYIVMESEGNAALMSKRIISVNELLGKLIVSRWNEAREVVAKMEAPKYDA